jgi:hypothetical protein
MQSAVTSTFLGGIVGHVTSRSYWIIQPENRVTMLCPNHATLLAWGNKPRKKKKKKRQRILYI